MGKRRLRVQGMGSVEPPHGCLKKVNKLLVRPMRWLVLAEHDERMGSLVFERVCRCSSLKREAGGHCDRARVHQTIASGVRQ